MAQITFNTNGSHVVTKQISRFLPGVYSVAASLGSKRRSFSASVNENQEQIIAALKKLGAVKIQIDGQAVKEVQNIVPICIQVPVPAPVVVSIPEPVKPVVKVKAEVKKRDVEIHYTITKVKDWYYWAEDGHRKFFAEETKLHTEVTLLFPESQERKILKQLEDIRKYKNTLSEPDAQFILKVTTRVINN